MPTVKKLQFCDIRKGDIIRGLENEDLLALTDAVKIVPVDDSLYCYEANFESMENGTAFYQGGENCRVLLIVYEPKPVYPSEFKPVTAIKIEQ